MTVNALLIGMLVIALLAVIMSLGYLMIGNPLSHRDHEDYVLHENDIVK